VLRFKFHQFYNPSVRAGVLDRNLCEFVFISSAQPPGVFGRCGGIALASSTAFPPSPLPPWCFTGRHHHQCPPGGDKGIFRGAGVDPSCLWWWSSTGVRPEFYVLSANVWSRWTSFHIYIYICIHYRSKVCDHLEMSLFFKEKHCYFNKDNIKLIRNTLYIVNVVNDYSRWTCLVSNEISPEVYRGPFPSTITPVF